VKTVSAACKPISFTSTNALAAQRQWSSLEEAWDRHGRSAKRRQGRWIGVSNFNAAQIRRAQAIAPGQANQPPYSP